MAGRRTGYGVAIATTIIEDERIRWVRSRPNEDPAGDARGVVVYWMQQSQRARTNPALEYAVKEANRLAVPLVVVFCIVTDYPQASARHFRFMLDGLAEVERQVARRGIRFEVVVGHPTDVLGALSDHISLLVCDRGYLPVPTRWRRDAIDAVGCAVVEIEGDVVVPVDLVSEKVETAARTIRPKIQAELDRFVVDLSTTALDHRSVDGEGVVGDLLRSLEGLPRMHLDDLDAALADLDIEAEPGPVDEWTGGTNAATTLLDRFIDEVLPDYQSLRNRYDVEPSSSQLSPYLHFGQISPVDIVRRVRASGAPDHHVEAFVEELVVRRELAVNYVVNEQAHDRFGGLPEWARTTLEAHEDDEREAVLTAAELEAGQTPDPIWNAIMAEIRERGWVHNQLRMYWGKQVLRWTNTAEFAFRTLLTLNNRYFIDGRDPSSYANVAWCFGLHDQGFQERPVIGKIRPFTDQALRRKGDLDHWLSERSERN